MKSCGCDIVDVNMETSQQMTGQVLKHVAGQEPVYIMACHELPFCYIDNLLCVTNDSIFLRERDGGIHGLSVLSLQW